MLAAEPDNATARLDLSFDLASLAKADATEGRLDPAIASLREALQLRRSVLEADPAHTQARAAVARAHGDLAGFLAAKGERRAAETEARRAVAERETLAAAARGAVDPPLQLASALTTLGDVLLSEAGRAPPSPAAFRGRRASEACALYRRAHHVVGGMASRLPSAARATADALEDRLAHCGDEDR